MGLERMIAVHSHIEAMKGEEGMEKLIQEIAKKIWAIHAFPRGETDWDRAVEQAGVLIARIGKAYADGELELPGEVGRSKILAGMIKPDQGRLRQTEYWLRTAKDCYKAQSIIALHKEGEK